MSLIKDLVWQQDRCCLSENVELKLWRSEKDPAGRTWKAKLYWQDEPGTEQIMLHSRYLKADDPEKARRSAFYLMRRWAEKYPHVPDELYPAMWQMVKDALKVPPTALSNICSSERTMVRVYIPKAGPVRIVADKNIKTDVRIIFGDPPEKLPDGKIEIPVTSRQPKRTGQAQLPDQAAGSGISGITGIPAEKYERKEVNLQDVPKKVPGAEAAQKNPIEILRPAGQDLERRSSRTGPGMGQRPLAGRRISCQAQDRVPVLLDGPAESIPADPDALRKLSRVVHDRRK